MICVTSGNPRRTPKTTRKKTQVNKEHGPSGRWPQWLCRIGEGLVLWWGELSALNRSAFGNVPFSTIETHHLCTLETPQQLLAVSLICSKWYLSTVGGGGAKDPCKGDLEGQESVLSTGTIRKKTSSFFWEMLCFYWTCFLSVLFVDFCRESDIWMSEHVVHTPKTCHFCLSS